jgi:hypothetical protein
MKLKEYPVMAKALVAELEKAQKIVNQVSAILERAREEFPSEPGDDASDDEHEQWCETDEQLISADDKATEVEVQLEELIDSLREIASLEGEEEQPEGARRTEIVEDDEFKPVQCQHEGCLEPSVIKRADDTWRCIRHAHS